MRWSFLRNLLDNISKLPVWITLCIELLLVVLIGYIDYITGDYSVLIFYGIPVCLAAWTTGDLGVIILTLISGLARYLSDYNSYTNNNLETWNTVEDILFLLIFGLVISAIKRALDKEGGESKR